jgi:hypothetical protein
MLKNLSRDPPSQSTGREETELLPDLWESPPLNTPETKSLPLDWHLPIEAHSLISGTSIGGLPQLPSHQEQSSQIILRDWLKLRVGDAKKLAVGLINALTLLSWLEKTA